MFMGIARLRATLGSYLLIDNRRTHGLSDKWFTSFVPLGTLHSQHNAPRGHNDSLSCGADRAKSARARYQHADCPRIPLIRTLPGPTIGGLAPAEGKHAKRTAGDYC
jgi:hypothetical protein